MNCDKYTNAVTYFRVSTKRQGQSGLGLEAQQASVASYVKSQCLEVVASFTEIETGTSKKSRVEIYKAIEAAKANDAVLVIAKLDRLARSVAFTSALMEAGVKFVAVDMPQANELTIHIMAAMAEHEAKMISQRTKAALEAAKARGVELGTPDNLTHEAQIKGAKVKMQNAIKAYSGSVQGWIMSMRKDGLSYGKIADKLNDSGETTRNGKPFKAMTVKRILDRLEA